MSITRTLKNRVRRLQDKAGLSAKKYHVILIKSGEDPEEVKRKYYEENDVRPGAHVMIMNLVFVDGKGKEVIRSPHTPEERQE